VSDTLAARYERFLHEAHHGSDVFGGVSWQWHDQGEGPLALVVLPGAVGGAGMFFILFEELRRDVRVIGLDLPFVDDAASAMDQMDALLARRGVEQAIFLGASFSGLFVQAFARRHPARTRGLILSHTGALDPARAARQRTNARRAGRIPVAVLRGFLRLVVRLLLRRVAERRFWIAHYDAALAALTRDDLVSRYRLEASIEELGGEPWSGDVLVIHSDNDAIAKPEQQERLQRQYPGAQWVEFKGTGHSSYSRDPLAYAGAVRAFVSGLLERTIAGQRSRQGDGDTSGRAGSDAAAGSRS
jgi:pimeloyl-ACP methyl ester carboxylesterase